MPGPITEAAGKAMGAAKGAVETVKGHTGIMSQLSEEHGEVSMLMKRCKASSDPATRKDLLSKIKTELMAHSKAEEAEFYAPLREYPETRDLVSHSKKEHEEIQDKLQTLSSSDARTDLWESTFSSLVETVEHHVKEEENELFPRAKKVLSSDQLEHMKKRFLEARRSAGA